MLRVKKSYVCSDIKTIKEELGLSNTQISEKIGVTAQTVRYLLKGDLRKGVNKKYSAAITAIIAEKLSAIKPERPPMNEVKQVFEPRTIFDLEDAMTKPRHRDVHYSKRTGESGNYQYWYRTSDGRMITGEDAEKVFGVTHEMGQHEHARRLLLGRNKFHSLTRQQIADEVGITKNQTPFRRCRVDGSKSPFDWSIKNLEDRSGLEEHHLKEALNHLELDTFGISEVRAKISEMTKRGFRSKEISEQLGMSIDSVRAYMANETKREKKLNSGLFKMKKEMTPESVLIERIVHSDSILIEAPISPLAQDVLRMLTGDTLRRIAVAFADEIRDALLKDNAGLRRIRSQIGEEYFKPEEKIKSH
jgi:DNA-binding CsgD family transcriptional regulator